MTKMRESKEEHLIRLALAGAKNCGKSALAVRFLTRRFIGEYDSHNDVTMQRYVPIADQFVNLQLKDTTGMAWVKNAPSLINWTSAIIVVYSITDSASFLIASDILELIHKLNPLNSGCTMLLGNKKDLKHLRQVGECEAKKLAMRYGICFMECSASESFDDIHSSFTKLILEALAVQNKRLSGSDQKSEDEKEVKQRRRSSSSPQTFSSKELRHLNEDEKRDSVKMSDSFRVPSPADASPDIQRDTPRHQRKHSIRRKISGLGSRLVGSQNGTKS